MAHFGLSACVVAVSGGIDSAIVLGLAAYAAKQEGSPIRAIVPVLLPVHDDRAATNQADATARGAATAEAFGLAPVVMDVTKPHAELKAVVDGALARQGDAWASGQLVAYTRTPALYYCTSVLTEQGLPAILLGTTNKDEGAYIGYFGKASDGMVDVQLISDIHKSEVYAVGQALGVPATVMNVTPAGDMYDNRNDEEVFGAPYTFVELYMHWRELRPLDRAVLAAAWDALSREQFAELARRLDNMHRYNGHKYLGKSPAVHLDLLPVTVEGGWHYSVWTPRSDA